MPVLSETSVTFDRLKTFIQHALTAVGLPDADAATVAALMAAADLQGSDGHGVSRLPQYVRRIKAGGFNVRPNIHVGLRLLDHILLCNACTDTQEQRSRDH